MINLMACFSKCCFSCFSVISEARALKNYPSEGKFELEAPVSSRINPKLMVEPVEDSKAQQFLIFNTNDSSKRRLQNLMSNAIEKLKEDPCFFLQPIAYSQYGADLGLKGLVSYPLQETRLEALNLQRTIFLPKGYSVITVCGGGSGSINIIIQDGGGKRFFMKYFFHVYDSFCLGHGSVKQFLEGESSLKIQEGDFSELAVSINHSMLTSFLEKYRKNIRELGVVVDWNSKNAQEDVDFDDHSSSYSQLGYATDSTDSSSDNSLRTNGFSRMKRSLDDSRDKYVKATFTIMDVANAIDLCEAISKSNSQRLDQLVNLTVHYLADIAKTSTEIIESPDQYLSNGHDIERCTWVSKTINRYSGLSQLECLRLVNFDLFLKSQFGFKADQTNGLRSFAEMISAETIYRYGGKNAPNPYTFLIDIFQEFPLLFCSKKAVFQLHGDGQASNLMVDENDRIIQVDIRRFDGLVSPYIEFAKLIIFGPMFTGAILPNKAIVGFDDSGLTFDAQNIVNLSAHQVFKDRLLLLLQQDVRQIKREPIAQSVLDCQTYFDQTSPDFGLNMRLFGALQAEADIGSFLTSFNNDPHNECLIKRTLASKVLAIKLQHEFIEYALNEFNYPKDPFIYSERCRLKCFLIDRLNALN